MPRKQLIRSSEHPYHISARCINRDWFRVPLPEVWSIFEDYLFFVSRAYELRIHSFVLMSNHFHMLASTPQSNLDESMNYLLREVSRHITWQSDRMNQTFGGPYHWTLIETDHYYRHAYKYVYRNPVEAGICKDVLEYPYSTLAGRLGFQRLIFPVAEDPLLENDVESSLQWLNAAYKDDHKKVVWAALNKSRFQLRKNLNDKKGHELETRPS
jgi:REP element-mobilizing transposase RayT